MEIKIVEFIQSFGNKFFDGFFWLITKMGEETFFLFVLLMIYISYSKNYAFKYSIYYITSVGINNLIKLVFARPRPFQASNSIICKLRASGYSFPSGHSQGYFFCSTMGMLEIHNKNNNKRFKISIMISLSIIGVLVMISRMYLGQHYLSDVLTGLSLGLALPFVFDSIINFVPKNIREKFTPKFLFLALGLVTTIVFLILLGFDLYFNFASRKVYKFLGVFMAMSIGYFVDKKFIHYKENQGFLIGLLKFVISSIVIISMYIVIIQFVVLKTYNYFLVYLFLGLICTIILPLCFKFMFKKKV